MPWGWPEGLFAPYLAWNYGTGFPKHKACLKPAWEPIILARKPGRVSTPLGIDDCRIDTDDVLAGSGSPPLKYGGTNSRPFHATAENRGCNQHPAGRYPANLIHDGSDEVMEAFASFGEKNGGHHPASRGRGGVSTTGHRGQANLFERHADTGTAARFFYAAKASKAERGEGNNHPTVKPLALMRWLVRLVSPAGGRVLDPFGGSGTTGLACLEEGRVPVLVERDPAYLPIIRQRVGL